MKKNHTKLIFYTSIIVTLLAIGAFVVIFKIIINKNEHTSIVLSTLDDKMIKKQNSSALTSRLAEIETIEKTLKGYFVDTAQIDSFIDYLEKLGLGFGTVIKVENFEMSSVDKSILNVEISSKGTFDNMMRVVKLVENAPYQIDVKKVSLVKLLGEAIEEIEGVKQVQTGPIWQLNITFSVLTSTK